MDYAYLGYTVDRQIVKGKVSAADERAAVDMLSNIGYRVVSIKPVTNLFPSLGKLFQAKVKSTEMITFSILGAINRTTIATIPRMPKARIAGRSQSGTFSIVGINANASKIKKMASITRSVIAVVKTKTLLIPVFCPRATERITSPLLKGKKLFPK